VRLGKRTRKKRALRRAGVVPAGPRRDLRTSKLQLGDPAYAFELPRADVERRAPAEMMRLADFQGRRPVGLIFGSYTCPSFRAGYEHVAALARTHEAEVAFLVIYVREAHPAGTREPSENRRAGIAIEDPLDFSGRLRAACDSATRLVVRLPVLVDGIDDRVTSTYGGWPNRLCLISREGIVRYRGKMGEIDEFERAIRDELR
jgi:hypothetical protein